MGPGLGRRRPRDSRERQRVPLGSGRCLRERRGTPGRPRVTPGPGADGVRGSCPGIARSRWRPGPGGGGGGGGGGRVGVPGPRSVHGRAPAAAPVTPAGPGGRRWLPGAAVASSPTPPPLFPPPGSPPVKTLRAAAPAPRRFLPLKRFGRAEGSVPSGVTGSISTISARPQSLGNGEDNDPSFPTGTMAGATAVELERQPQVTRTGHQLKRGVGMGKVGAGLVKRSRLW